jgi:hypothetical protein
MKHTKNSTKRVRKTSKATGATTPAQEQAQAASVKDLLASVSGFLLPGMVKVLEAVQKNLALVDLAGTPEGEKTCVDTIWHPFRNWNTFDAARVAIRACVRELLNYRHEVRAQVIAEAVRVTKDLQQKAEELKALAPKVRAACLAFDGRAQAFSQICAKLEDVASHTDTNFLNEATIPARDESKPHLDALRNEPKLRDLMRAYDLATAIRTAW